MIGQSMINIGAGARTRISSVCSGLFLLLIVVVAYPAINIIPISALAGVMFNVVYHTFEWTSLKIVMISFMPESVRHRFLSVEQCACKIRQADAFVIVLVTLVTLFTDLAIAVACGVVFSCLMFAWDCSDLIKVTAQEIGPDSKKVYDVEGLLFFGSTTKFLEQFNADADPDEVSMVCETSTIMDHSAVESLNTLGERYKRMGKVIVIEKVAQRSVTLSRKSASLQEKVITVEDLDGPVAPQSRHALNVESFGGSFTPRSTPRGTPVHASCNSPPSGRHVSSGSAGTGPQAVPPGGANDEWRL